MAEGFDSLVVVGPVVEEPDFEKSWTKVVDNQWPAVALSKVPTSGEGALETSEMSGSGGSGALTEYLGGFVGGRSELDASALQQKGPDAPVPWKEGSGGVVQLQQNSDAFARSMDLDAPAP